MAVKSVMNVFVIRCSNVYFGVKEKSTEKINRSNMIFVVKCLKLYYSYLSDTVYITFLDNF